MSDQGRWFKLWVSSIDDPDLADLSIDDFGRWCKLGAYIKAHGNDGEIRISAPARALCFMFQVVTMDVLLQCISRFPNYKITVVTCDDDCDDHTPSRVIVKCCNWRKYQVDSSTGRMRLKRARECSDVTTNVTPKKRREESKEKEEKERPPRADFVWSGKVLKVEASVHEKLTAVYDPRLAMAEYPKADLWLQNNPQRKRSNVSRFMASWLEKAARTAPKGGGTAGVGPNYF